MSANYPLNDPLLDKLYTIPEGSFVKTAVLQETLTSRQQFILKLLKAHIKAKGYLSHVATNRAIESADQVFGRE